MGPRDTKTDNAMPNWLHVAAVLMGYSAIRTAKGIQWVGSGVCVCAQYILNLINM